MFGLLKRVFSTAQSRLVRKYSKVVAQVNAWEKRWQQLSDSEVRGKTEQFKQRLQQGESLEQLLPEAYAVVKNVCRRLCGSAVHVSGYDQKWDMIPYDVQILSAIAMHASAIAEMQTGEGKTLTAAMPLYLHALTGKAVHLATVNDYLAERDCQWIGAIFRWLGLKVVALTNQTPFEERRWIYAADIVYGSASEFGFDYLRDHSMAHSASEQCQRGHYFAIIDEIDSVLIDEARTPLVISGAGEDCSPIYIQLRDAVAQLVAMQQQLCTTLVEEGQQLLQQLGWLEASSQKKRRLAKENQQLEVAFQRLWVVAKGNPRSKPLRRLLQDPFIRAALERLETYFASDQNKEQRQETLAPLYIIIDEYANLHELTDKGIQAWSVQQAAGSNDFIMLDLGHEYAQIDADAARSEREKWQRKRQLAEEDAGRKERIHCLSQMLRAYLLMERDVDYIVHGGEIVLVDENTGRPQPSRRFADGLHQALEAKEGVTVQSNTQAYASITVQNYFRMYAKLSGMTGTAITEAHELQEIYGLEVLEIPTHLPCCRRDADDLIFMTEQEKYARIVRDVQLLHQQGRPVLIGTESVEISEKLSSIFQHHHLPHRVLNARHHAKEAEVIATAGQWGAITLATNMAGRGTDIKLSRKVLAIGGLHVIGTTRYHSRRIDRQLRGRSGRLGDPGSSQFYVSFEDTLLRAFASPRVTAFLQRFPLPEGEALQSRLLTRAIESAQKRLERRNYSIRKHTLEYDDVLNQQRSEVYDFRSQVLQAKSAAHLVRQILEDILVQQAERFLHHHAPDRGGYRRWVMEHFPIGFESNQIDNDDLPEEVESEVVCGVLSAFDQKLLHNKHSLRDIRKMFGKMMQTDSVEKMLDELIRNLLIQSIDISWREHLLRIKQLEIDVQMRRIGQGDPLVEFQHEAFALFAMMMEGMKLSIARTYFQFGFDRSGHPDFAPPRPLLFPIQRATTKGEKATATLTVAA